MSFLRDNMNDLSQLYQDLILDHCRHPRHFGEIPMHTHFAQGLNPICGDEVNIYLKVVDNVIDTIQFTGKGCAICVASASLMCEQLQGKTVSDANELFEIFIKLFSQIPPINADKLGKAQIFTNVKNFPIRVKCATLPWHAMRGACLAERDVISTEHE
jgi:nitrogen fixation NifU-like protein